jgi:hypothetical protein
LTSHSLKLSRIRLITKNLSKQTIISRRLLQLFLDDTQNIWNLIYHKKRSIRTSAYIKIEAHILTVRHNIFPINTNCLNLVFQANNP